MPTLTTQTSASATPAAATAPAKGTATSGAATYEKLDALTIKQLQAFNAQFTDVMRNCKDDDSVRMVAIGKILVMANEIIIKKQQMAEAKDEPLVLGDIVEAVVQQKTVEQDVVATKKAPGKKATTKKAPGKKATAKKATTKKAPGKKATANKPTSYAGVAATGSGESPPSAKATKAAKAAKAIKAAKAVKAKSAHPTVSGIVAPVEIPEKDTSGTDYKVRRNMGKFAYSRDVQVKKIATALTTEVFRVCKEGKFFRTTKKGVECEKAAIGLNIMYVPTKIMTAVGAYPFFIGTPKNRKGQVIPFNINLFRSSFKVIEGGVTKSIQYSDLHADVMNVLVPSVAKHFNLAVIDRSCWINYTDKDGDKRTKLYINVLVSQVRPGYVKGVEEITNDLAEDGKLPEGFTGIELATKFNKIPDTLLADPVFVGHMEANNKRINGVDEDEEETAVDAFGAPPTIGTGVGTLIEVGVDDNTSWGDASVTASPVGDDGIESDDDEVAEIAGDASEGSFPAASAVPVPVPVPTVTASEEELSEGWTAVVSKKSMKQAQAEAKAETAKATKAAEAETEDKSSLSSLTARAAESLE